MKIDDISGYPVEVWSGWVWVHPDTGEQRWSKRATRKECEDVVLEVCTRLGAEAAFEETKP